MEQSIAYAPTNNHRSYDFLLPVIQTHAGRLTVRSSGYVIKICFPTWLQLV